MEKLDELRRRRGAGEHRAALALAQELLAAPERLTMEERVEVGRLASLSARAVEEYIQAGRFAASAREWAEETRNPALIGAARYHHGSALVDLGSWIDGAEQLEGFLAMEPRPETARYRAPCLFNLGVAAAGQRQYRAALARILEAEPLFAASGQQGHVTLCLVEAAWMAVHAGLIEAAGLYLERAHAIFAGEEEPDPDLQTRAVCHQALYHLRLHELQRAVDLCKEVLLPGRRGASAHNRALAAWITGEAALELRQVAEAKLFADLAMTEAIAAKWTPAISRANDLRQRVHVLDKDHSA